MKNITIGITHSETTLVTEAMSAKEVGSGEVAVYATPMMIALMENTASTLLKPLLDDGETSVGTMISTTHEAATPCGMTVSAKAEITKVEGRKITFEIIASDETGTIGTAIHERVVVQKEKFESKALAKRNSSL